MSPSPSRRGIAAPENAPEKGAEVPGPSPKVESPSNLGSDRSLGALAALAELGQPVVTTPEVVFLTVPFCEKDAAKKLGARWDMDAKRWFVPPGAQAERFKRWMNGGPASQKAIDALAQAPEPLPELPEALKLMEAGAKSPDTSVRRDLAKQLGKMGEAGLPLLIRMIQDRDRNVRCNVRCTVAEALGKVGRNALPYMSGLAHDERIYVRIETATALGNMGPEAMTLLNEIVEDPVAAVGEAAIHAAGMIGVASLPMLEKVMGKRVLMKEDRIRHALQEALCQLGPSADSLLRLWIKSTRVGEWRMAIAVWRSTRGRGPNAEENARILIKQSEKKTSHIAEDIEFMDALANQGEALGLEVLEECLSHPQVGVRAVACSLLGKKGADATPLLERALQDEARTVRRAAGLGLAHVHQDFSEAIIKMASRPEPECRWGASCYAWAMGRDAGQTLVALAQDPENHGALGRGIENAGNLNGILPALISFVPTAPREVLAATAERISLSLTEGEDVKAYLPLLSTLTDRAPYLSTYSREQVAKSLGFYGEEVLPLLKNLIQFSYQEDRGLGEMMDLDRERNPVLTGADSLKRIGPTAVPLLRELMAMPVAEGRTQCQYQWKFGRILDALLAGSGEIP